jgi:hypothetical protein
MPPLGAHRPARAYDQLGRRVEKSPSIRCSARCSCCSWFRMYFRIISSSHPTVLTQYPLAQQWSPVTLRPRPRYSRCIRMADFPFNRPTALATLYLGGILKQRGP